MKSRLRLYSVAHYVSLAGLAKALEVAHFRRTELSLVEWNDPDVVLDEIITFFPLRRVVDRDLTGVISALVRKSSSGVLVALRLYDDTCRGPLEEFLTAIFSALSTPTGYARSPGDFVVVLENYPEDSIGIDSVPVPVHPIDADETCAAFTYRIRTTGRKPLHYVNFALKVVRRHLWVSCIEISAQGEDVGAVVGVSEILKRYRVVKEKSIATDVEEIPDLTSRSGHMIRVPKLTIVLERIAFMPDPSTLCDHVAEQD